MSPISRMHIRELSKITKQSPANSHSVRNCSSRKFKSRHQLNSATEQVIAHSLIKSSSSQQLAAKQPGTLASKTAALKMGLSSAKIPRSHGIALLRLTLFFSSILLVLCLHTEMLAKGQLVHDCKSTPSLRNGNPQFLVNEVRKFVDNCIKTKDGIRFRKRFPTPTKLEISPEIGEYGPREQDTVPMEQATGSTTPLPVSLQKAMAYQLKEESLMSPPAPVLMVNEKPFGSPPAMLMAVRYLRDLARRQKQAQMENQDWNANLLGDEA